MIYISVPNRGWIHKSVAKAVLDLAADGRYAKAIDFPALHPPYDNFLNQAAKMVRESTDFDWWLNIDADNAPCGNPLDLIAFDKDIIHCPYPMWQPDQEQPLRWSVYERDDKKLRPWAGDFIGLKKVGAVATGCTLIHRRVFDNPEMQKHPFLSLYDDFGIRRVGPDMAFCLRAGDAGFEIWAHFDYTCNHYKEVNLLEVMTHV